MATLSILSQVTLFAELTAGELEALSAYLRRRRYERRDVIFRQEEPGTSLYIIEEGEVKIVLTSPEGKDAILALLGRGDFFGELALLDGEPRSADAVAKEDCQLLVLSREDFLRFLEHHPRVGVNLLAALSRRLRRTDLLVQDAAFLDVPARLARIILELGEAQGRPTEEGLVISSTLTQAELGAMVGATRESINKWIGFYQRQGLLRLRNRRLTILRPQELRKRIY